MFLTSIHSCAWIMIFANIKLVTSSSFTVPTNILFCLKLHLYFNIFKKIHGNTGSPIFVCEFLLFDMSHVQKHSPSNYNIRLYTIHIKERNSITYSFTVPVCFPQVESLSIKGLHIHLVHDIVIQFIKWDAPAIDGHRRWCSFLPNML